MTIKAIPICYIGHTKSCYDFMQFKYAESLQFLKDREMKEDINILFL